MARYKTYSDGVKKIVVVSTFAGKTVRGVANCNEKDIFDPKKGYDLAKARCDSKVALKRYRRAREENDMAMEVYLAADRRRKKMAQYLTDSQRNLVAARNAEWVISREM